MTHTTRVVSGRELHGLAHQIARSALQEKDPQAFAAMIILTGDRISCCDEGIIFVDDSLRGIATISAEGEAGGGEPTIVAVFVRSSDRAHGYGLVLLEAAILRCIERGFAKVRVDTVTKAGKKLVDRLPKNLHDYLNVYDSSKFFPI